MRRRHRFHNATKHSLDDGIRHRVFRVVLDVVRCAAGTNNSTHNHERKIAVLVHLHV